MKKQFILALVLVVTMAFNVFAETTLEKAQHRLPPVIYSLNIPQVMESGKEYKFQWSIIGYHDDYNIQIEVYDSDYHSLTSKIVSPVSQNTGQYSWGDIYSTEYKYETDLTVNISESQPLIVRFYVSPTNDPIDRTYLSCLVPSGLRYAAGDSSGRKIKILGVAKPYVLPGIVSDGLKFDFGVLYEDGYRALIYLSIQGDAPLNVPSWIPFSDIINGSSELEVPQLILELTNSNAMITSLALVPPIDSATQLVNAVVAAAAGEVPIGVFNSVITIASLIPKALLENKTPKYVMFTGGGSSVIVEYIIEVRKTDTEPWKVKLTVTDQNGIIERRYDEFPLIEQTRISTPPSFFSIP